MSLRTRMVLVAGVAVAIAVIAVAAGSYLGTRSSLLGQTDQSLQRVAAPVLARAQGPRGVFSPTPAPPGDAGQGGGCGGIGDQDEGLALDRPPEQAFGGASGTFTLVCPDGRTYSPPSDQYPIPATAQAKAIAASGRGQYFTDMTVNQHHIRVMVTGIAWRGALMTALPLDSVDNELSNQVVLLLVIGGVGILLAALLGFLVARTALAPIARFTRQTESIAANPERIEHERLDVIGSDELARLARTFNQTLDALERSVQAQRNLVADASHELRTPIATIRANLQLMRDEDLLSPEDRAALRADVIEELDELTALVADVVELARGTKASGEPDEVRLDAVVRDAIERGRRRAPGLTFQQVIEPTLVRGEPDRISRAVTNLLDNAAKWSPQGGGVEVTLHRGTLTIRDHGPGFNEDDLAFVFDRFHRAKEARSKPGSGLGLAIVRQAAEAHGGFAEAANAPDGGAVLRVSFGPTLELEDVPADYAADARYARQAR
ncbi:MAG: HAMP domain-containing histidine kinase [Solirubrobacterales bacterium]|nr:HAMP domain-containing histidine kinase [Solirubrobacterales bacterium]MBV9941366.1 HAMP domain-containing histidine kinase [Solirubrobacterales bacterium]